MGTVTASRFAVLTFFKDDKVFVDPHGNELKPAPGMQIDLSSSDAGFEEVLKNLGLKTTFFTPYIRIIVSIVR